MVKYLTYGMVTLTFVVLMAPYMIHKVDWTNIRDPRSTQYQLQTLLAVLIIVFAWPLILFALILIIMEDE